jgi:HEAT repeat protein
MASQWAALFDEWAAAVIVAAEEPPSSIFRERASPEEIEALELRLGTRLPPSYRAFLLNTNGADAFPGWGIVRWGGNTQPSTGLYPAASVGWLRDLDRGLATWLSDEAPAADADPWSHPNFDSHGPERDYLVPDGTNDPVDIKGGHLLYALAVSVNVDGYITMLNPLAVDADGEWEAWDFGTKLPGARRFASFAALLEADIRRWRDQVSADSAGRETMSTSIATVGDPESAVPDRISAAWSAFGAGARQELVPGLAAIARDNTVELGQRQTALQLLGYVRTPDAIAVLADVARDPEPRLRASAIPALAVSDDPAARDVAIEILADPSTPSFVSRSTYRPAGPVLWEADRRSGNRALLPQLAYLGEERAVGDVVAALRDIDLDAEVVRWDPLADHSGRDLLTYAYYLRDPRVAAALVEVADRFPSSRANVASHLVRMGATEQAMPLLRETLLAGDPAGVAATTLAEMDERSAGAILLESLRASPTSAVVGALAWHPSPEAVDAIDAVLDNPDLHVGGIDALETMRIPEAADVLAARAEQGDPLATRALARRRDGRCRDRLFAWLADPSPRVAFHGADGLRDLRDPTTADALLGAVGHEDPEVAVTATHALVSMASPTSWLPWPRLMATPTTVYGLLPPGGPRAGPGEESISARTSPEAYAHGLAFALPNQVLVPPPARSGRPRKRMALARPIALSRLSVMTSMRRSDQHPVCGTSPRPSARFMLRSS